MRFVELCEKDVINTCDGRLLGCVDDLEFDEHTGSILAIGVPVKSKQFSLFKGGSCEYAIPWCCIKKIGDDVILVELDADFYKKIE